MKGGKAGRDRRRGDDARRGPGRGRPKPDAGKRPLGGAPKKGSPKKPGYGGTSTSEDR